MTQEIPPFLFLADARDSWDAWRWALAVSRALEKRGGRGTLVITGTTEVPAPARSAHVFAQDHVTDSLVGWVVQRALVDKVAGRIGVLHVFGCGLSQAGAAMARKIGCRYFASVFRYGPSLEDFRVDQETCAGVIAEDEKLAARLRRQLGGAVPVLTLPLSSPKAGDSRPGERDVPALAAFGRWQRPYGMSRLVEASARLRDAGLAFQVFLQGSGRGEEEVRRLVATAGLTGATTFVDEQIESERVIEGADVVVLAGDKRGATLPVVSSMLAGKTVVVSDTEGMEDIVELRKGLLIAEKDAASVAEQIASAAGDPQRRRAIGAAAVEAALAARPFERSIEQLAAAYAGQVPTK